MKLLKKPLRTGSHGARGCLQALYCPWGGAVEPLFSRFLEGYFSSGKSRNHKQNGPPNPLYCFKVADKWWELLHIYQGPLKKLSLYTQIRLWDTNAVGVCKCTKVPCINTCFQKWRKQLTPFTSLLLGHFLGAAPTRPCRSTRSELCLIRLLVPSSFIMKQGNICGPSRVKVPQSFSSPEWLNMGLSRVASPHLSQGVD